jgi:hypothetical protein
MELLRNFFALFHEPRNFASGGIARQDAALGSLVEPFLGLAEHFPHILFADLKRFGHIFDRFFVGIAEGGVDHGVLVCLTQGFFGILFNWHILKELHD